jgi:Uma2 family endonuclease
MATAVEHTPSVAERYAALPEGTLAQLIGGEIVMSPAPVPFHQRYVTRLASLMLAFVEQHGLGEVFVSPIDVVFDNGDTYQPDIVFVAAERLDIIGEKCIEGSPDLVVEVLSLSNAYYDLRAKKAVYEQCGVKEYWIVDALKHGTIEVYQNISGEFRLHSHSTTSSPQPHKVSSLLLAGLEVDLDYLFAPLRRPR